MTQQEVNYYEYTHIERLNEWRILYNKTFGKRYSSAHDFDTRTGCFLSETLEIAFVDAFKLKFKQDVQLVYSERFKKIGITFPLYF